MLNDPHPYALDGISRKGDHLLGVSSLGIINKPFGAENFPRPNDHMLSEQTRRIEKSLYFSISLSLMIGLLLISRMINQFKFISSSRLSKWTKIFFNTFNATIIQII